MVISLERGADLHMAQLKPLPLTVSCFSEIQIGFTFLVPARPGSPEKRPLNGVCVLVWDQKFSLRNNEYAKREAMVNFGQRSKYETKSLQLGLKQM